MYLYPCRGWLFIIYVPEVSTRCVYTGTELLRTVLFVAEMLAIQRFRYMEQPHQAGGCVARATQCRQVLQAKLETESKPPRHSLVHRYHLPEQYKRQRKKKNELAFKYL